MTRLIGFDALVIALGTAFAGAFAFILGARQKREELIRTGHIAAYIVFALVSASALSMIYALVAHDFSISYVSHVGSRETPLFYTVISLWGALEGSILFWAWVLSGYAALVLYQHRERPGMLVPYAGGTLLLISAFFLILLTGPANPFHLVSPVPTDGPGPNPLLQNHILMAVHPPLLYLGYVGMSVPFSFAMGAVLSGEIKDDGWIRLTRRWTLVAWAFLSAAIIAGMWWSYEVLGWGGYWAWDPVENASFMPWLTATAFLHSVVVQERRGLLRLWNLNLISTTFLLTILGTFLTRSGVLSSVHAFTEGSIGYYFLAFIAIVLMVTFAVVAGSSEQLRSDGGLDAPVSRESVFLLNNLFLTAFMITVLVGTLYPLAAEAMRGVKVSVGEPFFNKMTLPICATLLFLMGVGPALPWRRATSDMVRRKLVPPGILAVVVGLLVLAFGTRSPYAVLAFSFGAFAIACNLREFAIGTAARMRAHGEMPWTALVRLIAGNRRRHGGYVAHLGVLCVTLGVAASSTFRYENTATIAKGQSMPIGRYAVRLDEVSGRQEPQRDVIEADVTILRGGRAIGREDPRMNFYPTSQEPVPTPAVRSRPNGDIYLNLMAFAQDGSNVTLHVIVEPLVPWIWTGGLIVVIGALITMSGARERVPVPAGVADRSGARPVAAGKREIGPAGELEGVAP